MNPKPGAKLEKLTIVLTGITLLICDATLAEFAHRHWQSLSGLSLFLLADIAVAFALLWTVQVLERGRGVCLAATVAAAVGAVSAVTMMWTPR